MSAESEKLRDAFAERLAGFDARLGSTGDDANMLADIQAEIAALLTSSGASEAEIRRVLQDRFEAGRLRKETFQLVKAMLDEFVTEKLPTSPTPAALVPEPSVSPRSGPVAEPEQDAFGATTIIPSDALPVETAEGRVQVGSILRDRFLLQEKVSGGSMGVVYKALDRRLAEVGSEQPCVALKVLSPALAEDGQALRALQQEAAKTRCLVHPHIVRFIDLDRDDDLYFLVLEWLEGRTLADILDSEDARSIDTDAAYRIVRQIGDALDYAHRCGIVHADIKPGNIMIMPNGDAKLFDFGVARVRQQHTESDFTPGVLGALTPAYSSMQVLGGEEPVAADDVFSLACLLYRLIAGYRVFGPRNAAEASQEGMQPQRPQGLSDGQWQALKKALSYARVTRFATVSEFLDALDDVGEETASFDAPQRFTADAEQKSPGRWIAIIVLLLGLAGIGAQQLGYLDPWIEKFRGGDGFVEIAAPGSFDATTIAEPEPEPQPEPEPEPEAATVAPAVQPPAVAEETAAELPAGQEAGDDEALVEDEFVAEDIVAAEDDLPTPAAHVAALIDFSTLPPATAVVEFSLTGELAAPTRVFLREDGAPALVDFVRDGDLSSPLTLRLEEVGFSGNRSPLSTGQYALSNAGLLEFSAGQERARLTLRAASDRRREADQQSTLRLRLADTADSELGNLFVILQDDDQRLFESGLPRNTVAFAEERTSISESDPAVQIDIVRFNPDNSPVVIGFSVADITATEGEDYFAPGSYSISFGPGQRSARILIPLVQDSSYEGDESFAVTLATQNATAESDLFQRIVVMIRDDDRPVP